MPIKKNKNGLKFYKKSIINTKVFECVLHSLFFVMIIVKIKCVIAINTFELMAIRFYREHKFITPRL